MKGFLGEFRRSVGEVSTSTSLLIRSLSVCAALVLGFMLAPGARADDVDPTDDPEKILVLLKQKYSGADFIATYKPEDRKRIQAEIARCEKEAAKGEAQAIACYTGD